MYRKREDNCHPTPLQRVSSGQEDSFYLTYNRLLKLDAQEKIRGSNTTVTNYHGFAMSVLRRVGVTCGVPELVYTFNRIKPPIDSYDVLILDEYQDIEQELADMLWHIKSANSQMQIIAVGDMMQKIYDKSVLNVSAFMDEFLGEHIILTFTKCFRLSAQISPEIGAHLAEGNCGCQ